MLKTLAGEHNIIIRGKTQELEFRQVKETGKFLQISGTSLKCFLLCQVLSVRVGESSGCL